MKTDAQYQEMFPKMYQYTFNTLCKLHGKPPKVLEVLAYLMVLIGEDVTKLVELMKEMESNNE